MYKTQKLEQTQPFVMEKIEVITYSDWDYAHGMVACLDKYWRWGEGEVCTPYQPNLSRQANCMGMVVHVDDETISGIKTKVWGFTKFAKIIFILIYFL